MEEEVRHPKNETRVGSPTINPNDKMQYKCKNKFWIRSKGIEQQAIVITNKFKKNYKQAGPISRPHKVV
jgi:hypothetical protein